MVQSVSFWFLILVLSTTCGHAQVNALTFQQLDSLQQQEKRPILVFIHTDWCKYCQAMKQTTFQDEAVRARLDSAFYLVSLNAEAEQSISVRGHTFHYQPTGNGAGQHELAQALGQIDGKLAFPTLCYLNADYEIIHQQVGFLTAQQLIATLEAVQSSP